MKYKYVWDRHELDVTHSTIYIWNKYEVETYYENEWEIIMGLPAQSPFSDEKWGYSRTIYTSYTTVVENGVNKLVVSGAQTLGGNYSAGSSLTCYEQAGENSITEVHATFSANNSENRRYNVNGYRYNGRYNGVYTEVEKQRAGEFISTVQSTSNGTYPMDGVQNGFWYLYLQSQYVTNYYKGDYIDEVNSENPSQYPQNGRQGDYWYVFDRAEQLFGCYYKQDGVWRESQVHVKAGGQWHTAENIFYHTGTQS